MPNSPQCANCGHTLRLVGEAFYTCDQCTLPDEYEWLEDSLRSFALRAVMDMKDEFKSSVNEFKQSIIAEMERREREARIDELRMIVDTKDKLNDIYGNDPRNNYGYHESEVREAADYLRGKHTKRIAHLQSTTKQGETE